MLRDQRVEHQPRDGMHQHGLAEGRTAARPPLEVDRRLHVDEGQRDELGEAAGLGLEVAECEEMARPGQRGLDMAEHDRRGRAETDLVRGAHHLEPRRGTDLVRADDGADLVVEDLGRGAGQRAEPRLLQHEEEIPEVDAERRRALRHLERREGVDMDAGRRPLHRAADVEIGRAGVVRVDAALHADFGGAARPRLGGAALDLVEREVIGRAAEVLAELALGEGAELAAIGADIGVVDVAGDDVADRVAVDRAAQRVGGVAHRGEIAVAGGEERDDLRLAQALARRRRGR